MSDRIWFSVKNLRVFYGTVSVLKGISLQVEAGSIVTLIGANGAGKSTTLRAVSGLVGIAGGEIFFEGKNIQGFSPQEVVRSGIAHVPEGRRIFPYMSVKENLMMGAFRRKDKKEIQGDLEKVFTHFPILRSRQNQRGGSLSGGEQQMLAIGRALMSGPKLLCIDEPSTGLAPLMRKEVFEKIGEINRLGITLLLVEQEVSTVFKMAGRNYVLSSGKIIAEGPGEQLLQDEVLRKTYLGL